jgi:adenosylcobinamide-GDP ribazoletransferase
MSLRPRLAEFQIAVMLLTRLPAGRISGTAPGMAASSWAWPLAGALVGGIAAMIFAVACALGLPAEISALLALAAGILATGGMHEDGLADMADGCGGGRDRAQKLEIMRDSRIGSYGVLALLVSVGLRVAGMAALGAPAVVVPALIALAMASRAALPLWLALLPPARTDGLGHGAARPKAGTVALALILGQAGWLLLPAGCWLPVAAAVVFGGAIASLIALRQLGGQTGDALGAAQQGAEIFAWLTLTILAR